MPDRPRFIHRTLRETASEYEKALSRALVGILSRSTHDLSGIVAALNETAVKPPGDGRWTEDVFAAEMERLGVYPNSIGAPLGDHPSGIVPMGASTAARPPRPRQSAQGGSPREH